MPKLPRPVDLINKTVGTAGLKVVRNIPFGLHPRQRLDIYRPVEAGALTRRLPVRLPVIVFFYGGSWQRGGRGDFKFVAAALAKQGLVVVLPDYRLYPEVKFPAFVEDGAAAIAWVLKNISAHGGDDGALFLMGHSAGAYNAMMLGLDPSYLAAAEANPAAIAGIIGLAGPYDFLPLRDPAITEIFSTQADLNITQPITHARESAPPVLLLHGGRDDTVLPRNTAAMAARLREVGGAVETRIYPKLGHINIVLTCLPYLTWRAPLLKDAMQFIAACRNGEFADARSEISTPMVR
jgi:acetyl esterase/lipase